MTKRSEGDTAHSFDDLAMGLDTGTITRSDAIKYGGAALLASAIGLFAASEAAQAEEVETAASRRRRCRKRGGDFCRFGGKCSVCCGEGGRRRRRKACCGKKGCNCCRRGKHCKSNGKCV